MRPEESWCWPSGTRHRRSFTGWIAATPNGSKVLMAEVRLIFSDDNG